MQIKFICLHLYCQYRQTLKKLRKMKNQILKFFLLIGAIVTLSSCGKSYLVRNLSNNKLEYVESSEVGNDFKEGDTIRTQNVHRVTSIGNAFETTKFTGLVISVENK